MISPRIKLLFEFLEKDPRDSFTIYSIAYEYFQAGELEEALKYFRQLKQIDPKYIGLYYHLGKVLEQLDEEEKAMEAYREGIQLAEELKDHHSLGELQRALKSLEDWADAF